MTAEALRSPVRMEGVTLHAVHMTGHAGHRHLGSLIFPAVGQFELLQNGNIKVEARS